MTEMPKTEPIISEPIIMQITAATPTPPRFCEGREEEATIGNHYAEPRYYYAASDNSVPGTAPEIQKIFLQS